MKTWLVSFTACAFAAFAEAARWHRSAQALYFHLNQSADDDGFNNKSLPKKTKAKRFVPPTVAEVTSYCQERGNRVNPEAFVDFYASKGWMVGKKPHAGLESRCADVGTLRRAWTQQRWKPG